MNRILQVPAVLCLGSVLLLPGCDQGSTTISPAEDTASNDAPANVETATNTETRPETNPDAATGLGASANSLAGNAPTTPANVLAAGDPTGDAAGRTAPERPAVPVAASGNIGAADMTNFLVKIAPTSIDLGDVPTEETATGTVVITNTADTPRTLVDAKSSCGCTAVDFPKNHVLQPGEDVEVVISMKGGQRPRRIEKTVTFIIEGQDPIRMPVAATAVSYVTITPDRLDPARHPDGQMVLRAIDEQPFVVTSMHPPVIEEFPTEPSVEHRLTIDWERWEELGSRRKLLFYLDHPKCVRLYGDVNAPPPAVAEGPTRRPTDLTATPTSDPAKLAANRVSNIERLIQSQRSADVVGMLNSDELSIDATDRFGNTALAIGAKHGDLDIVNAALNAGADYEAIGQLGRTPIMFAAQSKNPEAVRALLDSGANVLARDQIGGTPLTWAAGMGDAESVEMLIEAGADINVAGNITGFTPLIWAALSGEAESVEAIVSAGAPTEVPDLLEGATPLMHAVRTGRDDSARVLLEAGADLEARDNIGRTVLLMATSTAGSTADTIKMLIEAGADLAAIDRRGKSALDLARGRTDVRAGAVVEALAGVIDAPTPDEADTPADGG